MKGLYKYIKEETATPMNFVGMGDPTIDNNGGTEPLPSCAKSVSKKRNKSSKKKSEEE